MFFINFFILLISCFSLFSSPRVEVNFKDQDQTTKEVTITVHLKPHELLLKDSVIISLDHPDLDLAPLSFSREAESYYDEQSKDHRKAFKDNDVIITSEIMNITEMPVTNAALHIMYHINTEQPTSELFPLTFQGTIKTQEVTYDSTPATNKKTNQQTPVSPSPFSLWHWSQKLSNLIEHTKSLPIQLLLAFLLGILVSLTPCIYPMIPITIGILNSQQSSSFVMNALRALSYTFGLATTFSLLGFCASCTATWYSKLLANPISVAIIVLILGYLALSMFGFYELYVPRFAQSSRTQSNGSLFSAFMFGAASGTIASPCVSPGLILLLSIAATLGNAFLGFLLLFVFGLGISTPLLIIGLFSSSLAFLPQSGMWMVEVKKIFGLLLFAVCFYYLANVLPLSMLYIVMAIAAFSIGTYYLYTISRVHSPLWRKINTLLGIILVALSVVCITQSIKYYYISDETLSLQETLAWQSDYKKALEQAQSEHKKLFVDVWAPFCSICVTINKTVLIDDAVVNALNDYVLVKIDGSQETESYTIMKTKFNVSSFPAFLIIDPNTETVIKQWSSELYHMPREQFVQELMHYEAHNGF